MKACWLPGVLAMLGLASPAGALESDPALAKATKTVEQALVELPTLKGGPFNEALERLFNASGAYGDLVVDAQEANVRRVAEAFRSMQGRIAYPHKDLRLAWSAPVMSLTRQCQVRRLREAALVQFMTHPGLRTEMRAAAIDQVVSEIRQGMSASWARQSALLNVCGELIAQDRPSVIHFSASSVSSVESPVGSGFIVACLLDEAYALGLGTGEFGRSADGSEAGLAWKADRTAQAGRLLPELCARTTEAERLFAALASGKLQADITATSDAVRFLLAQGDPDPSLWSKLLPIAMAEMRDPRGPGSVPIINLLVDGFAEWLRAGGFLRGSLPVVPPLARGDWQKGTAGLPPMLPAERSDARAWAGWIDRALAVALSAPLLRGQGGWTGDPQMVIKDLELLARDFREASAR